MREVRNADLVCRMTTRKQTVRTYPARAPTGSATATTPPQQHNPYNPVHHRSPLPLCLPCVAAGLVLYYICDLNTPHPSPRLGLDSTLPSSNNATTLPISSQYVKANFKAAAVVKARGRVPLPTFSPRSPLIIFPTHRHPANSLPPLATLPSPTRPLRLLPCRSLPPSGTSTLSTSPTTTSHSRPSPKSSPPTPSAHEASAALDLAQPTPHSTTTPCLDVGEEQSYVEVYPRSFGSRKVAVDVQRLLWAVATDASTSSSRTWTH